MRNEIDEYIDNQREEIREILNEIRNLLRETLPDAEEKIAWRMPTYKGKRNIIHFAAFKNHFGIYPGPETIEFFADELKNYKTSKGAIQFPYDIDIPYELIAKIALYNNAKDSQY